MRMSDGRVVIANGYNKGTVFFEAPFPGGETLATYTPNQYLEPEGRFIPRPPSALPHKELAKQPEPKPKAQTKNKDHTGSEGQIESETKRQSKACTDPGKTQDAGASGTYREKKVNLPHGDAYTSNRSSGERLGFCHIVHEESCWQDGFHWSGLEQKLFLCLPCGCCAAIATASEQTARCADLMVWRPVECLGNGRTTLHPQREEYHCGIAGCSVPWKKISSTMGITITTITLRTPTNTTLNVTPAACASVTHAHGPAHNVVAPSQNLRDGQEARSRPSLHTLLPTHLQKTRKVAS